ncbi:MAG: 3-deoxy-7-phosphoheptulonate synthase [Spirochaetaceae bacterium]|nr:3-deoxy-7-phosphoheptulonate synthase [Spirochaetaceae bacterium]
MVVVVKKNPDKEQFENLTNWLKSLGVTLHISEGESNLVLGLVGDTSSVDIDLIRSLAIVEDVKRIQEPYKNANRKFHPEDSIIKVADGVEFGGGSFNIIAGPCSVESEKQVVEIAERVKKAGATMLRGGAFKPRTSPYSFQGLGCSGIELLIKAKEATGLPIITEIMEFSQLPLFDEVDVIQVGARNMQNFELLKELGHTRKPILLKRGLANTIQELLMSAEYIMAGGNEKVILCERVIRTFEKSTRNTLDVSAVPVLKKHTHLPVVIDPSHACGYSNYVKPLALAATAIGCDGLMIEVHNDPQHALCDGAQSLTPDAFDDVAKACFALRPYSCRY